MNCNTILQRKGRDLFPSMWCFTHETRPNTACKVGERHRAAQSALSHSHVLFNPRVPVFKRRLVCLHRCVCLFDCVYLVFKVFLLGYFSISRVQLSSQLVAVWSAFSSVCLCNIKERKCSVLRVSMLLLLARLHSAGDNGNSVRVFFGEMV